jgi:hypothetical protein
MCHNNSKGRNSFRSSSVGANKKNTAGDTTIHRGRIHSALLLNQFNKAFPFFKGKTELVPMNIGIDNDLGYAKRATKRVLRLP